MRWRRGTPRVPSVESSLLRNPPTQHSTDCSVGTLQSDYLVQLMKLIWTLKGTL